MNIKNIAKRVFFVLTSPKVRALGQVAIAMVMIVKAVSVLRSNDEESENDVDDGDVN
jgi:hypothetical protein